MNTCEIIYLGPQQRHNKPPVDLYNFLGPDGFGIVLGSTIAVDDPRLRAFKQVIIHNEPTRPNAHHN